MVFIMFGQNLYSTDVDDVTSYYNSYESLHVYRQKSRNKQILRAPLVFVHRRL